jgi:hypothetical protein
MGGACSTYDERRDVCRVLVGKPEGKDHLQDPGVGGRIILRCTSGIQDVGAGTCKCGDEPSGSMKCGECLD